MDLLRLRIKQILSMTLIWTQMVMNGLILLNISQELTLSNLRRLPRDQDNDLLLDLEEVLIYNTKPDDNDSDGDGIPDGMEVYTYGTDPTNPDTDGDGISMIILR